MARDEDSNRGIVRFYTSAASTDAASAAPTDTCADASTHTASAAASTPADTTPHDVCRHMLRSRGGLLHDCGYSERVL